MHVDTCGGWPWSVVIDLHISCLLLTHVTNKEYLALRTPFASYGAISERLFFKSNHIYWFSKQEKRLQTTKDMKPGCTSVTVGVRNYEAGTTIFAVITVMWRHITVGILYYEFLSKPASLLRTFSSRWFNAMEAPLVTSKHPSTTGNLQNLTNLPQSSRVDLSQDSIDLCFHTPLVS